MAEDVSGGLCVKRASWWRVASLTALWTVAETAVVAQSVDEAVGCSGADRLFTVRCGLCHLPGGIGTLALAERSGSQGGLLWNQAGLTEAHIETVVRTGVGGMPRFTRVELPDEEAQRIARYLTVCRGAVAGEKLHSRKLGQ
jgi:mono/diheme cytochrome c family protein